MRLHCLLHSYNSTLSLIIYWEFIKKIVANVASAHTAPELQAQKLFPKKLSPALTISMKGS